MLTLIKKSSLHGVTVKYTLFAALLLAFTSLGCSGGPGPRIGVKGIVVHGPWFSPDGQFLILPIGHIDGPSESPYGVSDMVAVYQVGTWKKVFEYTTPSNANGTKDETIDDAFMCRDPGVLIHSSQNKAVFIFRSMTTGQEIKTVNIIKWPSLEHWCDLDDNLVFVLDGNKVTVLDGSTGDQVREYVANYSGTISNFIVQKEKDRLLMLDTDGAQVFIFQLTTTEFLGQVLAWPQNASGGGFSSWLVVNNDQLLFRIHGTKDGVTGTFFFLVDLKDIKIKSESSINGIYPSISSIMDPVSGDVFVEMTPDYQKGSIATVDYSSGEIKFNLDLDTIGAPFDRATVFPLPDIQCIYVSNYDNPLEAWIINYPDLSVRYKGISFDNRCGYPTWVPNGKFMLIGPCGENKLGVYDPVNYKLLDSFFVCNGAGTPLVDPLERWAAVQCQGDWGGYSEDYQPWDTPGAYPSGAGVAIVDLTKYRSH